MLAMHDAKKSVESLQSGHSAQKDSSRKTSEEAQKHQEEMRKQQQLQEVKQKMQELKDLEAKMQMMITELEEKKS